MKQIIITLESPEIKLLEKDGNKDAIFKVNHNMLGYMFSVRLIK